MIFFCAQNKRVSNTVQIILLSLYFLTFCTLLQFSIYYSTLCSFSPNFWAHSIPSRNYALLYFCSSSSMAILLTTHFFSVALEDEIWQKINPIAFQLVLRDQSGWVRLGFVSDYDQFGTVSLVSFSKDLHNFWFMSSVVY